jgi:glucokinase
MAAWAHAQAPASDSSRTAKQVCKLALEGNELARRVVDREAYYLSVGIANLINLFVPDSIVLGGGLMRSAPLFLDGIRKQITRGCRFVPHEKTELALASLGKDANLIGAARVWHNRFGNPVPPTSSSAA